MRRGLVFGMSVLSLAAMTPLMSGRPVLGQPAAQTILPAPPRVFIDTSYFPIVGPIENRVGTGRSHERFRQAQRSIVGCWLARRFL